MNEITNKQDIEESQECLKRAEDEIERQRQRSKRSGLARRRPPADMGRLRSLCAFVPESQRNRLRGTPVEFVRRDVCTIVGIADIRKRTAVIDALSDPDNPASSLQEAQKRAGLDHHKLERIKRKRAESMRREWMSADPETLSKFLELVAAWDHELASALLGAVRLSIKSWEES